MFVRIFYYDIEKIPNRPYGLVLGTSKYFANNTLNLFYYNRLLAAQRLFEAKKSGLSIIKWR